MEPCICTSMVTNHWLASKYFSEYKTVDDNYNDPHLLYDLQGKARRGEPLLYAELTHC